MQIFVKSLNHTVTVDVPHDATVADLKACVENHEFIPATLQRLVLTSGIQLNAGVLRELGVEEASTVTLMLSVNGGMRAKWRKKRMRRLRRKRRKMRQRAR